MIDRQMGSSERLLVTVAVMLAVLIQVLDTTIANVALPHMQASLGATQESINWVLTSYIVASAIALPISGWLADRVGRKRLLIWSVIGFTIASFLCAIAQSLPEMVGFRILQGITGAFLVPLAQATLFDINPPERHARAMALFGGGIMIGPIMGPVLGGWLTDSFDWRWVFLVNVPVGALATVMLLRYMPTSPRETRKFDLFGFAMLGLALGSLQLMLERGHQLDWFDSVEIWIEAGLVLSAGWLFVTHTLLGRDPLFDKSIFADRNFALGLMFMLVTGVLLLAGLALLPPLLQNLYGYSVFQSGVLTMPRGVGTLISMLLAGRLVGLVDLRILVALGLGLMGWSLHMMTGFAIEQGSGPVIWSGLVQGLGLGLVFVTMQSLAFATLAPKMRTSAASLLNLSRNIGGSIGISLVATLLARNLQTVHADLAGNITEQVLPSISEGVVAQLGLPASSALALVNAEINRQAAFIAYIDDFWIMMWLTFAAIPLVLLLRPAKPPAKGEAQVAMAD
ncbi:DHA2 family efflux MFS transporter permease subunit [Sphingomonas sp. LY160]|uniref:DHA2 family efflux MFS transporter permease subunit n=1 Tax=Sphingomonas sp. LY160 TaxID=3095342 RepID=UPI002ADECE2E|nr:DHA2 family efflux MFS transporter permease subunit [Sphingomonas sp. LY160]MEA1070942.1 DHA2 family efflux MFS transporter permease subunit [Sphingomonas sp. LY160]